MTTIKKRAIRYARAYPGQTATQIANALKANVSTVSAALYRAAQAGSLSREESLRDSSGAPWDGRGTGPRGGLTYGPRAKP